MHNDILVEFCGMNETIFRGQENFTHIKALPFFSVVQSVSGSFGISIDNSDEYFTGTGGIFIAPPQYVQKISHFLDDGSLKARRVFLNIVIDDTYSAELLYNFPIIPPKEIALCLNEHLDSLFASSNPFDRMSLTYQIAKDIMLSAKEREIKYNKSLLAVLDYIKTNYASSITISDLAQMAHISESNLYASFKNQFGISPIAYLNNYRLVMATKFLKTTDDSIESVANSVGVADVRYFSKIFRRKFAMTPSAYRKNIVI